MSIINRIDQDIKEALKAGEKDKLTVLRGLKSDFKYKQIELGKELTDELAMEVLSSAAKKRRESIGQYKSGNRDDLVRKEQAELAIIEQYLPQQLSEDELREIVQAAVEETGAESMKQMGQVMQAVMPKVKGRADGKLVNKLVSEILAN
ncbi:GatB/YqeY domain-containing protein [candidate division GN15 bacterium]|nr:GatB/YqeY domain-containing protein [candidate division GN15 bacterium]